MDIISTNNELVNVIQRINLKTPNCAICKNVIHFHVGDVIFGDIWYHEDCWKNKQIMTCVKSENI